MTWRIWNQFESEQQTERKSKEKYGLWNVWKKMRNESVDGNDDIRCISCFYKKRLTHTRRSLYQNTCYPIVCVCVDPSMIFTWNSIFEQLILWVHLMCWLAHNTYCECFILFGLLIALCAVDCTSQWKRYRKRERERENDSRRSCLDWNYFFFAVHLRHWFDFLQLVVYKARTLLLSFLLLLLLLPFSSK